MDDSAWIFDLVPIPDFIFDGLFIKELFDANDIDLAIPAIIFFILAAIVHLVRFYTCACMKGEEYKENEEKVERLTNKGGTLFLSYVGTALLEDAPQLCMSILYLSRRIEEDPDYEWTKVQMTSLATSFTSIVVLGGRCGWLNYKGSNHGCEFTLISVIFIFVYWFTAVAPAAVAVLTQSTLLDEAAWVLPASVSLVALFGVSCCSCCCVFAFVQNKLS